MCRRPRQHHVSLNRGGAGVEAKSGNVNIPVGFAIAFQINDPGCSGSKGCVQHQWLRYLHIPWGCDDGLVPIELRISLHRLLSCACTASQHKLDGSPRSLGGASGGFLPVYVGLQIRSPKLSATAGTKHGQMAARLMDQAGFHSQTICYLDLEDGTEPSGSYAAYISSWVEAVTSAGYVAGIYCSHRIANWCRKKVPYLWTFRVPRGTSGQTYPPDQIPRGMIAAGGIATQYRQNVFFQASAFQSI